VNEVKLNDDGQSTVNVELAAVADSIVTEDPEGNDDKGWVSLTEADQNLGLPRNVPKPQTISEQIAQVSMTQYTIRVFINSRQS
jgi:hypothetical protein